MVYLLPVSAVPWFICLHFLQLCGLLASRLCSSLVVWPPTSTVLWFIGLQSLQNQQTRQIISAGKTSHKHNNKDLIRPYGNLTWHASKYKVLKLHQRYTHSLQFGFLFIRLQFLQFCGLLISTQSVPWFTGRHSMQFCGLLAATRCSSVVYWPPLDAVWWF